MLPWRGRRGPCLTTTNNPLQAPPPLHPDSPLKRNIPGFLSQQNYVSWTFLDTKDQKHTHWAFLATVSQFRVFVLHHNLAHWPALINTIILLCNREDLRRHFRTHTISYKQNKTAVTRLIFSFFLETQFRRTWSRGWTRMLWSKVFRGEMWLLNKKHLC